MYMCSNDEYHDDLENVNTDNIANLQMLVAKETNIVPADTIASKTSGDHYTEFVGFANNGNTLFCVFAKKRMDFHTFGRYQVKNGNLVLAD